MRLGTLVLMLVGLACGQITQPAQFTRDSSIWSEQAYWSSVAFLASGHLADHRSSADVPRELNPLLRNRDGGYNSQRGALIKLAVIGGNVAVQRWLIRKNPQRRKAAIMVNTALGGVGFGVAAANGRKR